MANQIKTNARIEEAFTNLLQTTRFEKLTVTTIVKEANISNQTFYRYYTDKIDLATQLSYKLLSAFALIYGDNSTWKVVSMSMLYSIKNHITIYKRLIESPEGLEIVLKSMRMIAQHFTGKPVTMYESAIWAVALKEWRKNGFKSTVEEVYQNILEHQFAYDVISDEELRNKYISEFENTRLRHFNHSDEKAD